MSRSSAPLPSRPLLRSAIFRACLLLLGADLATGCSPGDSPPGSAALDDDLAEPAGPVFALHSCAPSPCEGLLVARPNRPLTRCADGGTRPLCPVARLDFGPSGLAEPEQRKVFEAVVPAGITPRALVRGALRPSLSGPTLGLTEARLTPSPEPPAGPVAWVSPDEARCGEAACSALRHREANLAASRLLAHLSLDEGAGDARQRNLALVEAFSRDGLLASGTTSGGQGNRSFAAAAVYPRLSSSPPACGDELERRLSLASSGLLWPSESDSPVSFARLSASGEGPPSPEDVRASLSLPEGAAIADRPLDHVFGWLARSEPGMAPDEAASAARFRALRWALERDLSYVTAFAAGSTEVHLLIIGRSRCGELAGVATTLIET